MSLQVWLPLNGDLHNQGLSDVAVIRVGGSDTNFAAGKIGQGLSCNGSTYWKVTPVELSSEASICCWSKTSTNAKMPWILETSESNKLNLYCSSSYGYTLNTGDAGDNRFKDKNGNNIAVLNDGEWHHFVVTFGSSIAKLYIDGIYRGTASTFRNPTTSSSKLIKLAGGYNNAHSYDWNGMINDFRVYDHCLSVKEVEEIAKGLVLHYKLDSISNPNLFTSLKSHNPTQYLAYQFNIPEKLTTETYTMQLWDVDVSHTGKTEAELGLGVYWGGGTLNLTNKIGTKYFKDGHADYLCFQIKPTSAQVSHSNASNLWLNIYNSPGDKSGTRNMSIGAWKLEKGAVATPLDVFGTTIYDSSGYSHNGTIVGNLAAAAGSPRYDVATVFNGSSAIKVNDNNWASQGMKEMTINLWIKPTAAFTKLFSCTESGGWNTESGTSGYLRFPVHVYTDAEQTSTAYKYDSKELQISTIPQNEWTMLTFVYDSSGTKTYINGRLHHTYSNVSYGIHYNMNARLFLGCEANTATASSPYYTGSQSDFRIYATALTPDQILELYNTSATIDKSGNVYAREFKEQ